MIKDGAAIAKIMVHSEMEFDRDSQVQYILFCLLCRRQITPSILQILERPGPSDFPFERSESTSGAMIKDGAAIAKIMVHSETLGRLGRAQMSSMEFDRDSQVQYILFCLLCRRQITPLNLTVAIELHT
jgi:hypothetical protein